MEGATCSSCARDGSRESVKCQVRHISVKQDTVESKLI